MKKKQDNKMFINLPDCVAEYIQLVIKKMRWRKKVRADVQAELTTHFEDALKDCNNAEEKERKAKEIIDNFGDAELIAVLARRAKKRCRPLWQKTAIKAFKTLVVMIGLLILYVTWFFSGKPNITTDYLAELNRMVRPADADNAQNAAVYYDQAAEKIKNMSEGLKDIFVKSYYECNEPEKEQGQEWLAKNQDVLSLISTGSEKPYYWRKYEAENNEMMKVMMPYLTDYRNLIKMLGWEACHLAQQGDFNQAFKNLITIYKLGKHTKSDPMLVGQVVAIAIERLATQNFRDILGRNTVDLDKLAEFSSNLQAIIQNKDFRINFGGDKLFVYDEIQRCFTNNFMGPGHLYIRRLVDLAEGLEENDKKKISKISTKDYLYITFGAICMQSNKGETLEKGDRLYDFYNKIANISPVQQRLQNIDIEKNAEEIMGGNLLIRIMKPAFLRIIVLSYETEADVQATLTIIAAIRYKQDTGDYPDSLQQMCDKGYMREIPIDPYSDRSLVYKKTENGFTLYSLGSDFDDDGGKRSGKHTSSLSRYTIWPADANDGDAVFWPVVTLSKKPATNAK